MKFTSLKTSVFLFIAASNFFEGTEEFFIAPTVWHYIHYMGETRQFLGFVQASYSLGIIIAGPIAGTLADKTGHIKCIVGLCFLMKIAGNFLYSIPSSPYNALFGRFLCGVGCANLGPLHGQLACHTPVQYRAKLFLIIDGMYLLGSVFGPAIGSFATFHINIFGWDIGQGNSPGVILMLIWIVTIIAFCFLPSKLRDGTEDATSIEWDVGTFFAPDSTAKSRQSTVFCVFFLIFTNMYYVGTAVFYTPLLAQIRYHLPFIFVKLLFLTAAFFSIILFLLLFLFSKSVDERNLFVSTHSLHGIAILVLTYLSWSWFETFVYQGLFLLWYLSFGLQCYAFSLGCSLLSQITDPEDAAFNQGAAFSVLSFGFLVSRIVSGFIFGQTPLLYYCLGLGLSWIAGTLWFSLEYKNLQK